MKKTRPVRINQPQSFRAGVVISLVGYALPPVASLAATPLLARALGVDGRGYLAAATSPALLLVTIGALGMPEALTYFVASGSKNVRTLGVRAVVLAGIFGVAMTGVLLVAANVLAGRSVPQTNLIILAAYSIIPTLLLGVLRGIAMGRQQWHLVTWERGVSSVSRLGSLIGLATVGHLDLVSALICSIYVPLLGALPYIRLAFARHDQVESSSSVSIGWRRFSGYGLRVWAGTLTGILLMRLDQTLMAPLSDAYQLGLYVVAVNISEVPLIVNTAYRDVTFASESHNVDDRRVARAAQSSLLLSGMIGLAICVTLPLWLVPLFGGEFAPASLLTVLMVAAVVVGTPGSIAGSTLSGRGVPQLRSWSLVIACVVNIALVFLLIPPLGAYGAALATLAGNLLSSNLNIVWLNRRSELRFADFYLVSPQIVVGAGLWAVRWVGNLRNGSTRES